jgi:glycosyltransferase involved in cell wall biosynthesis
VKICFIFGKMMLGGRDFDFANLYESPRGLTGSEVSCIRYATEMAKRGHDVSLFVDSGKAPTVPSYQGVKLGNPATFKNEAGSFDVAIAWSEPNYLRLVPPHVLRLVDQQINDYNYCAPGFDAFVDAYMALSEPLKKHLAGKSWAWPHARNADFDMHPEKWEILPNGCDPTEYGKGPRVPGRMAYLSSPDRGLHLALEVFPRIKARVPSAHLKVYYHGLKEWAERVSGASNEKDGPWMELGQRARYITRAMRRLEGKGVEYVGSTSRVGIARALDEAEIELYPCDTVSFTEGFGNSVVEGCASGALPVISGADAFEHIYGNSVPMVPGQAGEHLGAYVELVVRALTDRAWADEWRQKARALAEEHAWPKLAPRLEEIITRRMAQKGAAA